MYYRIADIAFRSQLCLPGFDAFACEPCEPDTVLEITEETPPEGIETAVGPSVCRKIEGGWFLHSPSDAKPGLIVSSDYARMRLIRKTEGPATYLEGRYVRLALECLLARRGYVSLHAACVALDGKAIAFTGNSGLGKSTRAVAWQNAFQASLVNGDRPLIRVDGPEAFGVPWDGKECCYRSVHFPLEVICEVHRSHSVFVRRMSFRQKRLLLMRQCFLPMWDTETAAMQMVNIVRLASRANIVRIFCGPAEEDARALRRILDTPQAFYKEEPDMKVKSGFILRNVVGESVVFPAGDNINRFNGTLLLNEVSSFIWEKMQNPISHDDLVAAIVEQYDIDQARAAADLDTLLAKLREYDVIEED